MRCKSCGRIVELGSPVTRDCAECVRVYRMLEEIQRRKQG
jgi:hypothetical protein